MRKLDKFDGLGGTSMYRYFVNCHDDLETALGDVIIEEGLELSCSVRGKGEAPKTFPYFVIAHADSEYNTIELAFISKAEAVILNA